MKVDEMTDGDVEDGDKERDVQVFCL